MQPILFVTITFIGAGCLYLQYRIFSFENDGYSLRYMGDLDAPSRLTVPFYAGWLLVISAIIYGAMAWAFPATYPGVTSLQDYLGLVIRFGTGGALLIVKGYFGPTVAGGVICYALYGWAVFGEFQILPVLEEILEWVFSNTAKPLHLVYLFFVTAYGLVNPLVRFKSPFQLATD